MTTLRHSPPRSKKESSAASESAPAVEPASDAAEAGPDARQLKAAAHQERQAAKEAAGQRRAVEAAAKQVAKQRARAERGRSREQAKNAKADAQDAAAARAGTEQAQQEAREDEAPAKATRRTRVVERAVKDDHIVEPPREPKLDRADRRRRAKAERVRSKQDQRLTAGEQIPSSAPPGGKRVGLFAAGLLGAVGLICSVVLALGALLVALGATDGNAAYDSLSAICDALVGPLRDLFSFSGTNAHMKESLVAWGAGSIGYLLVGILVQSFLRSWFEKD